MAVRRGWGVGKIERQLRTLPAQGQMAGGPDLAKVKVTQFCPHPLLASALFLVQPWLHRATLTAVFPHALNTNTQSFSCQAPSLLPQPPGP